MNSDFFKTNGPFALTAGVFLLALLLLRVLSGSEVSEELVIEEAQAATSTSANSSGRTGASPIATTSSTAQAPARSEETATSTTTTSTEPPSTTSVLEEDPIGEIQLIEVEVPTAPLENQAVIDWWTQAVPFLYEGDVLVEWDVERQISNWSNPQNSDLTVEAFEAATEIGGAVLAQSYAEAPDFERFPEYFSPDARSFEGEVWENITVLGSSAALSPNRDHVVVAVLFSGTSSEVGFSENEVFEVRLRVDDEGALHPVPCFLHFEDCSPIFSAA